MSLGATPKIFPANSADRNAEIAAYLDRLLTQGSFTASERRAHLLRYMVDRTLAGEGSTLSEYGIGLDVFSKPPSFDPRLESVVRNEVMRLRQKLATYYEGEGESDPIKIVIPKRSYAVLFEFQDKPPTAYTEPPRQTGVRQPRYRLIALPATVVLIVIAGFVAWHARLSSPKIKRVASSTAEDLYLQGRYYWEKRSAESLPTAIGYFSAAISKDPGYAKAYVGLADCYNLLPEYTDTPAKEAYPHAMDAAKRAVQLDDSSAEAHASLAFASAYGAWDFETGDREFKRAIALDPNYVPAHHWRATMLMTLGRGGEALAEIERARKLYPASNSILADKGLILYSAGHREEALGLLQQLEAAEPSFLSPYRYLATVYLGENDIPQYFSQMGALAALGHDSRMLAGVEKAEQGYRAHGVAGLLAAQESLNNEGLVTSFAVAQTAALMHSERDTIAYLRKSLNEHEPNLLALRTEPSFKSVRQDPDFREIERKLFGGNP